MITPIDYTTLPIEELLKSCTTGKAAAWQEFVRRFHGVIAITASRIARRRGEASLQIIDDLVQDTYLKLCSNRARLLRECRVDHPNAIFGFLKIVAANVANDHFKALHAAKRAGSQSTEPFGDPWGASDPEGRIGLSIAERALLLEKVDARLRDMTPPETRERDQMIFWLYYRWGLTAKEIAKRSTAGLSPKGVESRLHRLTQLVRTSFVGGTRCRRSNTTDKTLAVRPKWDPDSD